MEEFLYHGLLFDIYKNLLNESNIEYYSLYYEENLTLQEIAENKNVSKSYAGSIIKKTTEKLEEFESILHIYEKKQNLEKLLEETNIDTLKKKLETIIE